jgi:Lipopolysaccharide-assembly
MTLRAVLVTALALLASCGYSLSAGKNRLPEGAQRIFVRPFEDRTTDAEAGALVAAALRRELARRDAAAGPEAPARIEGAVEETSFGASSPNGTTYKLAVTVSARLVVDGRVRAEQRARREEDWLAGQDPLESEGRRRLALRRAAEALAREIVERFEMP